MAAKPTSQSRPRAVPRNPLGWPPTASTDALRLPPPPRRGGALALLRFMRARHMLTPAYGRVLARLVRLRYATRAGRRLVLDGLCFVDRDVELQIGRRASVELGRWAWIGRGTRIRCHEGTVSVGAKTVIGQDCTLSAYQRISIGRECVLADRVMLIDFDHRVDDPERPIRLQGIVKQDVQIGHNVWVGHGASVLRGVRIGNNAIVGTGAVVTRDVPDDAVVAGVPARVVKMREAPKRLRWA